MRAALVVMAGLSFLMAMAILVIQKPMPVTASTFVFGALGFAYLTMSLQKRSGE